MKRAISHSVCILGILAVLAPVAPATTFQDTRPRLIVLTDIGGDPDDYQSMIRLMLYANEFDVQGLIAMSRMQHGADTRPDLIRQIVDAYGQVRPNLLLHKSGYPTRDYLLSVIKAGNSNFGMAYVGAGKDTQASNWIISVVDRIDARPVHLSTWGAEETDLAQALWRVRNDRTPAQVDAFVAKLRVYFIGKFSVGDWIRQNFPKLWCVLGDHLPGSTDRLTAPFRGMYIGGDMSLTSRAWLDAHVRTGHGPLGALYPNATSTAPNPHLALKEGDTPGWFYFLPNGLGDPTRPEWGSWGGRYGAAGPAFLSTAYDTVGGETSRRATVWRWRPAFQNAFQARMDWCVKPVSGANHPPVAVVAGSLARTVTSGAVVTLDASGSSDPDGNGRSYRWWKYNEPSSYTGALTIANSSSAVASFTAPSVTAARTIHVILEVTDNGAPPLTSYKRVVVTVNPISTTNQPPTPTIISPSTDGQIFAPGSTLSFSGSASDPEQGALTGAALTWSIDRIGDGFAAAKLATTGTSGSRVLSGTVTNPAGQIVDLGVVGSDYDLILRATDSAGAFAEAKRRYRLGTGTTTFDVTITSVSTGRPYSESTARTGALYYIDRSYTIASLSPALDGGVLLRTANDDKSVSASSHLTFTVTGAATVYVGYDGRATSLPTWLRSGWTATSNALAVTDAPASPLKVYSKAVPAGTVTLGGNLAGGATGAFSNYIVVVKSSTPALAAAKVTADVWIHADDSDGDGLTDGFEAANYLDPSKADSDGDGNPDETELDAVGRTFWETQEAGSAPSNKESGGACGLLGLEVVLLLGLLRLRSRRSAINLEGPGTP